MKDKTKCAYSYIFRYSIFIVFFLAAFSISVYAQQSTSLYVGQSTLFSAPKPPAGASLNTSTWGCEGGNVSLEELKVGLKVYGVKATVKSYFTGTAVIRCDYYYYWDDQYGNQHQHKETTNFYLSCIPVNIRLNTTYMNLDVGKGARLEYTLSPSISPTPTVRMYSSDTRVASINSNGYVRAEGSGDCVIMVENSAGPDATCSVHVNKVDPTSVSLSAPDPIYIGQEVTLTPRLYPDNAQTTYSWSSNDKTVAEISNGVVTGKSVGTARITVTTANNLSASCNVEVYKPVPSKIELNKSSLQLPVSGKETLTYNVSPSYAIYSVTWESDAPDIVSVNNGKLEAKSPGTANITVITDNGKKSVCKVTVPPEPTAVSVKPDKLELVAGQKKQLSYSFTPSDAATLKLTWKSSNSDVTSVSDKGEVSAKTEGTARISVETANGVIGSCDLTVYPAPSSISVKEPSLQLHIGDVTTLTYSVLPENAVYKVTWKSSNTNVASVSDNGEVIAKMQGSAKITVSTDNGLSSSCNVSVYPVPSDISLNKTSLTLVVGDKDSLIYTVSPSNALYTVSWSSNSPNVVSVKDGRIEAKKGGKAKITVSTDNGKTATCQVTVPPEPNSVVISPDNLELFWGRKTQLNYSFVPANAATLSLIWESSDPDVATIDQEGIVQALRPGKATLTATTRNSVVGKCEITVPQPLYQLFVWTKAGYKTGYLSSDEPQFNVENDIVHFQTKKLTLNIHKDTLDKFTLEPVLPEHPKVITMSEEMQVGLGMTIQLNCSIYPIDSQTQLTWFSDNPEIISVTKDGEITALNVGEANLTVQSSNGLHATTHITVPEPYLRFYVWMRDGEVHGYDLEERPDVTLGEKTFTLTTTNQTVEYEAYNIVRFTLEDKTVVDVTTDITTPEKNDDIYFQEGTLHISGCIQNSEVRIYDIAGSLVQTAKTDDDGNLNFSLAQLRTGIYIISTEKSTIKIHKR